MEREHSLTPSSALELSVSQGNIKNTLERKKEFDKRVSELSNEFNTLDFYKKKSITRDQLIHFFNVNVFLQIF